MKTRTEHDSLGEIQVPAEALYGAQTERARRNFGISAYRMPVELISALGMIKVAAAAVNQRLGLLEPGIADAIASAAEEVTLGDHNQHFPLDVFQTGSGTSTNMNANEVIATLATRYLGKPVHPNDHVNLGQSSNDVIPSAIHVATAVALSGRLSPALVRLADTIHKRSEELRGVVKTARTHLMDAVPIDMAQELSGWEAQVRAANDRIDEAVRGLLPLPIGGTAVGTGLNSAPEFGPRVAAELAERTGLPFVSAPNRFAGISAQDAALNASAQLRGVAVVLRKIADDLRWMNSGPNAGLAEIELPALQPGSSIMPGKVNPVIPEAVAMACVHAMGNDSAVMLAAQAGNFQLNTMLPLIGWSLLTSAGILTNATDALATNAVASFKVRRERLAEIAGRNPILVTALAPRIGYEASAKLAKEAYASGRSILEVALEHTRLTEEELKQLLDPARMTRPTPD